MAFSQRLWAGWEFLLTALVSTTRLLGFTETYGQAESSSSIISSPRSTVLPYIAAAAVKALPYPPDIFPGARYVDTPYGVFKAFEWGSEQGKKVVLVHGDTTPSPVFASIANSLVKQGCRILLLDLWGRGYSDTPLGVPHDVRLYSTQIILAIESSSLEWKSQGFSMIGHSLGGGITMAFAARYPHMVESIVLLAPGGIIRHMPDGYRSPFFRYPWLCTLEQRKRLVARALGLETTGVSEITVLRDKSTDDKERSRSQKKRIFDMPAIVQWQFDNHHGLIHSFFSNNQHGPIMYQHQDWERVGRIMKGEDSVTGKPSSPKLQGARILAIFGKDDSIVNGQEVAEDLLRLIGDEKSTDIRWVSGGHDFPVHRGDEVVNNIASFWGLALRES